MTDDFINEFKERNRQVRHYYAVLATAEKSLGAAKISRPQEGRLFALRSGAFLILYNLIESTTRASIEAIHDRIFGEEVPLEKLNRCLRKEVLRLFKAQKQNKLHDHLDDFTIALVATSLSEEFKVAGNVDAKFIKELGRVYGFPTITSSVSTWNGSDLLTIKTNRNDLAHGRKSYEELGRNYTLREMRDIGRRSTFYLSEIVTGIARYMQNKDYLS